MPLARTPEEILARYKVVEGDDWLGFKREVLLAWMPYEQAKPYLKADTTAEYWAAVVNSETDLEQAARHYLAFAVEKILNHRSISASRSVDKLAEYAWLLGRDDVVSAMDSAPYEQYGAPKVKAFADGMGWQWRADSELARMADGAPCSPECGSGCGR